MKLSHILQTYNCSQSTIAISCHIPPLKLSLLITKMCFSVTLLSHSFLPIIIHLSSGLSVQHFYKLPFPHPWFILLSNQQSMPLQPQGDNMCVMSYSVIPCHGDRSLTTSITKMEVPINMRGWDSVMIQLYPSE